MRSSKVPASSSIKLTDPYSQLTLVMNDRVGFIRDRKSSSSSVVGRQSGGVVKSINRDRALELLDGQIERDRSEADNI
jgi:hypothetical protein